MVLIESSKILLTTFKKEVCKGPLLEKPSFRRCLGIQTPYSQGTTVDGRNPAPPGMFKTL